MNNSNTIQLWALLGLCTFGFFSCTQNKTPCSCSQTIKKPAINEGLNMAVDMMHEAEEKMIIERRAKEELEKKINRLRKELERERAKEKSIIINSDIKVIDDIKLVPQKPIKTNSSSPFSFYLASLVTKYHSDFNMSENDFKKYLEKLLKLESGNAKRFIPKFANHKYLEKGDCGNGLHAWQIDKRWHRKYNKPMTFEQSGDYAIRHILLSCYRRAKKLGFESEIYRATLTCYNSGQFNDNRSTNKYGKRGLKA